MELTSKQVATELGVSDRQVRRLARAGSMPSRKHGNTLVISSRQAHVLARLAYRGRNWSDSTADAALDLLSRRSTEVISGSSLSRLKRNVRTMSTGELVGRVLRGRFHLRSKPGSTIDFSPSNAASLGLTANGGLGVLVSHEPIQSARRAGLARDDSGNVAVVSGTDEHRTVLEAMALFAAGSSREHAAAKVWLKERQSRV